MTTLSNSRRSRFVAQMGMIFGVAMLIVASAGCGDNPSVTTPTAVATSVTVAPTSPADLSDASNGTPDSMFGDGGKVITDLNGRSDEVHSVAVQADGKIVAAGQSYVFPQDRPRFALVRYNADGSLDNTFGEGGQIITGMTDDEYDYSVPHALALQEDGKIVVAGTTYSESDGHNVFALARFNEDGTFDKTFGEGGKVLSAIDTSDSGFEDVAFAMALDKDGKIVLAGSTGSYPSDFAAARYLSNGELDTTFGDKGKVVSDLGGNDKATAVAIQPDGKIVLAGEGAVEDDDWAMLRYMPDGKPDASFGNKGIASLDFKGGEDHVGGMVLRPDGKIVLGGTAYIGVVICIDSNGLSKGCDNYSFAMAQYTADGVLDESFGSGGTALYEYELESGGYALALQPDGKAVLAGHFDDDDFAAIRVDTDGGLDSSFGEDGLVRTPFGRSYDVAYAIALQPDGKIILAGAGVLGDEDPLNSNFALTRYGK